MCTDTLSRIESVLSRWDAGEEQSRAIYTSVFHDSALQEASAADRRREQGVRLSALDGLLFSLKASIDVKGQRTDACSPLLSGRPPAGQDAPLVTRLRRAGAVIVGKTQMTELAFSGLGLNPHYPLLRNPRDLQRVTGGSSSGAGASVAAGLADIAIGGDTGGSIRIPAALCGVVGFKPGQATVPTTGVFPLSTTLDCLGPLAHSVSACREAFSVLADSAPRGCHEQPCLLRRARLDEAMYDSEVVEAFESAMSCLEAFVLPAADTDLLDEALADLDTIAVFTSPELFASLQELGVYDLSGLDPMVYERMQQSHGVSAVDYARLILRRQQWMQRVDGWWPKGTVIAMPTVPCLAPRIVDMPTLASRTSANARLLLSTRSANLLDLPAVSIPLPGGKAPVGLMLVGARGTEYHLLAVAQKIESMLN